jgi:hypothetical protein
MWYHVVWVIDTSVLEEHTASIFRVEETKTEAADSSEVERIYETM